MKVAGLTVILVVAASPLCRGGEIYGNVSDGASPVRGARVEVRSPGKPSAVSDAAGSYKLFVPEQGKFQLKLDYGGQAAEITVYSYKQSVRYDLTLQKQGGQFSLRRK